LLTLHITPFHKNNFDAVAAIYAEGAQTGVSSLETSKSTWEQWDVKFLKPCRFVALVDNQVAGWYALSSFYKGVVEDTIYVARKFRDKE
jgi:phosphinothricin acetyltransferase|tara:strand:+ start:153 stop:419 length:267 start_codon:yes stop_codon:yes gene_type:complete